MWLVLLSQLHVHACAQKIVIPTQFQWPMSFTFYNPTKYVPIPLIETIKTDSVSNKVLVSHGGKMKNLDFEGGTATRRAKNI